MKIIIATCVVAAATSGARAETITATTTVTIDTSPGPSEPQPEAMLFAPPALVPQIEAPPLRATATPDRTFRFMVATGPALGFDTKDKCSEGECIAGHVEIGGVLARRLFLMVGASVMVSPDRPQRAHHHVETLALQYWPTAQLWGELGVGVGSKRTWNSYVEPPPMSRSGVDPAWTFAVGYEAIVRADYSVGVQARIAGTTDVDHTSFGQLSLGVSWY